MRLVPIDGWWGDDPPDLPAGADPVGYAWMVREHALDVMPHHRWSFTARSGRRTLPFQHVRWEVYPAAYRPEGVAAQLEFALKHDGVNLEILRAWFETFMVDEQQALEGWVRGAPTSAYARRAWYLYELLSGRQLSVEDARAGAYVTLLDPEAYHVADGRRSRRHRVSDNLFGGRDFSPIVRRTPTMDLLAARGLSQRIRDLLAGHDADTLARVVTYLYKKETRSSFEIENEQPSTDRMNRFVQVLRGAHEWPAIGETELVRLQNLIVTDPRRHESGYRDDQNYVGGPGPSELHYLCPRPEDLPAMMGAWVPLLGRLVQSATDPVVAAAAASFAFVYLHPFGDGNGRIHRFLVHYVLARKHFAPAGLPVPVSAVMLARMKEYEATLERFSAPLMQRVRYELDSEFRATVLHDTSRLYRYPDLTAHAEKLYGWVASAIEEDVPRELTFMLTWREARARVKELVELPERMVDHLVARCLENRGRLSHTRRRRDFASLADDEIERLERAIRDAMVRHGMESNPG